MRYSDSTLRTIRNHFGLSQAELARCLGIDRTLLAHIEAGRRPLPQDAAWRMLSLLRLLPPPHGSAPPAPPPPDAAEATPETLDALQWRLRVCRHEMYMLDYKLERQLPRLLAARHRRALPTLLAALPPLPGAPADAAVPDPQWAARLGANAVTDLARFGVQARALLEARRAGLAAEAASLENALTK
ncbi:helix-turn-helix domain-containing protein [Hymenobacter daeguensis]